MVIKVLFVVLILSTAAMVAVGIAFYLRVRRHFDGATSEAETTCGDGSARSGQTNDPFDGSS